MSKQLSQDDLRKREIQRREANAEFTKLKEQWSEVRQVMSAEAITLAWFLLGDKTWTATNS